MSTTRSLYHSITDAILKEEFKNEYERELQSRASQAVKEVETDTFVANGAVYQMLGFITNDELHWTVSKETIKKYFTSTGGFENDGVWIDDHAKQVRKEAAARARKERKKARAAELSSADTAS